MSDHEERCDYEEEGLDEIDDVIKTTIDPKTKEPKAPFSISPEMLGERSFLSHRFFLGEFKEKKKNTGKYFGVPFVKDRDGIPSNVNHVHFRTGSSGSSIQMSITNGEVWIAENISPIAMSGFIRGMIQSSIDRLTSERFIRRNGQPDLYYIMEEKGNLESNDSVSLKWEDGELSLHSSTSILDIHNSDDYSPSFSK